MAKNFYDDYPERTEILKKLIPLNDLVGPFEEVFGDPSTYSSPEEAIELFEGVLSETGKLCANDMVPHAEGIDREGVRLEDQKVIYPEALAANIKKCAELGIFSGHASRKAGGHNLPNMITTLALEMFGHACPNTALTIAAYSMTGFFEKYADAKLMDTYFEKLLTNECKTSMALTEAGAGSDLGKLQTSAKPQDDHFIVNGTKQFITNGDGDITLALVRTDSSKKDLEGLSVLVIPRELDGQLNYRVMKIEDKVCLHGSPTCEIIFENSKGYLIGEEGNGFRIMLDLMNEARVAMGAIAVGISSCAVETAKNYAKERVTMGKPIIQHPMVADMLYEAEIELRASRELMCEAARAQDWMRIYEAKGDKKNFRRWKKRYIRLTPLIKYKCSEDCVRITKNAVQILGGYGVCREYPVERLWRESIIYPIYEGTSQIQSLMVLKDTLKDVATQATGFLGSLAGAWAESKVTRDPIRSKLLQARGELNTAIKTILMSIVRGKFKSDIDSLKDKKIQDFLQEFSLNLLSPNADLSYPFLCAERLTRIVCDYYTLKCMVDHHQAGDKEHEHWILEYAELALPRMRKENEYMLNRLPSTLEYIKQFVEKEAATGT